MSMRISDDCKITKVSDPTTAGTSDVTSASVDMASNGGYQSVIFMTSYGTPAANNLFHVEASSDDSSFSDVAGSEVDLSGASDEDQWVDIESPPARYVRVVAARGTSSTLGDIWAIQYNGRGSVSNLTSGTIYGKALTGPATGTK